MHSPSPHIQTLTSAHEWLSAPFAGQCNAIGWVRSLQGNFEEIVQQVRGDANIIELTAEELMELDLTEQGQLAREVLLSDLLLLTEHGALPTLNIIRSYHRDETHSFFPTDVYSFHVDRAPVPTETIVCTYYGESTQLLPNAQAEQKVLIPDIRNQLRADYSGTDQDFECYLREHFFDLHYRAKPHAQPIVLGTGHLWKLAVEAPGSSVLPCIHRAPVEQAGQSRLLLIC